jgi:hypothetical protein
MICKNCGNAFEGKFCNVCGQKADVHRFTFKHALEEFFHTFTHVDSGILFLIKELFKRPGTVAREYIEGRRKKYFSPAQYLVLAVAAATFLTIWLEIIPVREAPPHLPEAQRYSILYSNFMTKYFNIVLFISVPLTAFFSWLLYKKSGFNYSENIILNTFLSAQRTLMYILLIPVIYLLKDTWYIGIGLYFFIYLIYAAWAYIKFFNDKVWLGIIRSFLIFLFSWITSQTIATMVFRMFFYRA